VDTCPGAINPARGISGCLRRIFIAGGTNLWELKMERFGGRLFLISSIATIGAVVSNPIEKKTKFC
jgi:hypothetical protein